jgi:hypothetical protein
MISHINTTVSVFFFPFFNFFFFFQMADYSTLTMSPNIVTYNNSPLFQRRSSIRRGTIASISKDIRVNDVTEIIKTQKALIQKERIMNDTQSVMLKRRHSMMNINVNKPQPKKQLPARIRTMSNGDLKNTDTFTTTDTSAKLRLDERVINHPRKCAACIAHQEEVLPTESMPSMSSNNSSTSSLSSTPSLQANSLHHEIIKNLNYGITNYSHQIQDLVSQPIEKKHIQECKALIVQQQQLLSQLEALVVNDQNEQQTPCEPKLEPKKQPSHLLALFSSTPKASTTQVVIRQKPDKKEADTIFSVQGVCTTVESSYIPDQVRKKKYSPISLFHILIFIFYFYKSFYQTKKHKIIRMVFTNIAMLSI